jgi:hypothetical protein
MMGRGGGQRVAGLVSGRPFGWYMLSSFGGVGDGVTNDSGALNLAITTINTAGQGTLVLDENKVFLIDANVTIPSNITLKSLAGGRFKVPSGRVLTVNAHIRVPRTRQVFEVTDVGGVLLSTNAASPAYGPWFGMVGDGATDSNMPWKTACGAIPSGGRLHIPSGTYVGLRSGLFQNKINVGLTGEPGTVLRTAVLVTPNWDKVCRFDICDYVHVSGIWFDFYQGDRFGGLEFYDCTNVYVHHNRFYDSLVVANPGDKDRNSVLFYTNAPNFFLNPSAPVTQSINLAVGTYIFSVQGAGSLTAAAGTAVGTGFAAATQAAPVNNLVITTAGTVTFTVTGSLTSAIVMNIFRSENIHVFNNVFQDRQPTFSGVGRDLYIHHNKIERAVSTGGACVVLTNWPGVTIERVHIHHNEIIDTNGHAIDVAQDAFQFNGVTLKDFNIHHNTIRIRTADAGRAINLGPATQVATTNNTLSNINLHHNDIYVEGSVVIDALIFANNSAVANWTIQYLRITDNLIRGNATGTGIDIRQASYVDISSNHVMNVLTGIGLVAITGCTVTNNVTNATTLGYSLNVNSSTGYNHYNNNRTLGTSATAHTITGSANANDFICTHSGQFSAAYSQASVAITDGTNLTQDITVTGVRQGDLVKIGLSSYITGGVILNAEVIANDTIRIYYQNESGGSRTFGAGTVRGTWYRHAG